MANKKHNSVHRTQTDKANKRELARYRLTRNYQHKNVINHERNVNATVVLAPQLPELSLPVIDAQDVTLPAYDFDLDTSVAERVLDTLTEVKDADTPARRRLYGFAQVAGGKQLFALMRDFERIEHARKDVLLRFQYFLMRCQWCSPLPESVVFSRRVFQALQERMRKVLWHSERRAAMARNAAKRQEQEQAFLRRDAGAVRSGKLML